MNLSEAKQVQFNKMDYQLLKELRQETQVSFSLCKKALEESGNDKKKALELLKEWGIKKAAGKSDRATNAGGVYSYIHHNNLIGAIVELQTETDFVSGNADFKKLGAEVAMQAASIRAKNVEELLKQNSIREPSKTIDDMIKETIASLSKSGKSKKSFNISKKMVKGSIFDILKEETLYLKPELLVLGSHGRSGLAKILSLNVTENFLANPSCDVLVVI